MEIIGHINNSTLICANNSSSTNLALFSTTSEAEPGGVGGGGGSAFRQLYLLNLVDNEESVTTGRTTLRGAHAHPRNLHPFVFLPLPASNSHIIHASLQRLVPPGSPDSSFFPETCAGSECVVYSLLTVVYHRLKQTHTHGITHDHGHGHSHPQMKSHYAVTLFLLETTCGAGTDYAAAVTGSTSSSSSKFNTHILEQCDLVKEQSHKLHSHVLPCEFEPGCTSGLSTPGSSACSSITDLTSTCSSTCSSSSSVMCRIRTVRRFVNRVLVLHLQEGFTIFRLETTPGAGSSTGCSGCRDPAPAAAAKVVSATKLTVLSSEYIPKQFSLAQWNPESQFLAFTHKPRRQSLSSGEFYDSALTSGTKQGRKRVLEPGTLSVYQFHTNYPRESVLNFPLPIHIEDEPSQTSRQEFFLKPTSCALEFNPFVLTSTPATTEQQLRVLSSASSGCLYVVQLLPISRPAVVNTASEPCEECDSELEASGGSHSHSTDNQDVYFVKYVVHILHHNKSLNGTVKCHDSSYLHSNIQVEACLVMDGQFLAIIAWPVFIHVLDVGSSHEPSHHLVFNSDTLLSFAPNAIKEPSSISFEMACSSVEGSKPDGGFCLIFNNNNHLQSKQIQLTSSLLVPLVEQRQSSSATVDTQFIVNTLHYLVLHLGDVAAAKQILCLAGQSTKNIWLSNLFQEFIVSHAHAQTKKQLTPNMRKFLHLLPYCPSWPTHDCCENLNYKLQLKPIPIPVSTMLLSPNQRVIPTYTKNELWTLLWELNSVLTKSKRFSHKTIADKLLISLQCYKPEVLSRATTPRSPSSPMIWSAPLFVGANAASGSGNELTPLALPFSIGIKGQFLLPFAEFESCTANKQEFIYSINLREITTHLLKEHKDSTMHGHTVGGLYVNSLVESSRLLCHLVFTLLANIPSNKTNSKAKDKGFRLIETLNQPAKVQLFMLLEHYVLSIRKVGLPLPNGFNSFFAYLGYNVLHYDQFLAQVHSGIFDLQMDVIKIIMADLSNSTEKSNPGKVLRLITLTSKSRANRILNTWNHPIATCIKARQHAADLLSGNVVASRSNSSRRNNSAFPAFITSNKSKQRGTGEESNLRKPEKGPLGAFFSLLSAKANQSDIDYALLTEATMLSMME